MSAQFAAIRTTDLTAYSAAIFSTFIVSIKSTDDATLSATHNAAFKNTIVSADYITQPTADWSTYIST